MTMAYQPSARPDRSELNFEGRYAQLGVAAPGAEQAVGARVEGKGFEGLQAWGEEPDVTDALARVEWGLVGASDGGGGGREDFGDLVGGKLEGCCVGHLRHAFTAPPGEIWDQDMQTEVKLGLVEDDPTAGAPAATVKRIAEHHGQDRRGSYVRPVGAGLGVQLAAHDLANDGPRQSEQVFVARAARGRRGHRLAPPNSLQIHRRRLEWLGANEVVIAMGCQQYPGRKCRPAAGTNAEVRS
jgi:hypothetical protein